MQIEPPIKHLFYEVEIIRGHWSVRELKRQIATQYFERSGLSLDKEALAKLAHKGTEKQNPQHVIRDPYVFEVLGLKQQEVMTERKLEDALLNKLQNFLLELGHGFCFKARQMSEGNQSPIGILLRPLILTYFYCNEIRHWRIILSHSFNPRKICRNYANDV